MVLFISLSILLVLAGLFFILPPLLGRYKVSEAQQNDINLGIYQQQLQELEADPDLGDEQKELARIELEKSLLQDVDASDSKATSLTEKQISPVLAVSIAIGLPVVAIGLYLLLGPAELPELVAGNYQSGTRTASNMDAHTNTDMPAVNEMVAKLEARLESNPDDAQGWPMLARSYMFMKRYQDAAKAFDRALILNGEDPQLLTDYAEAVAMLRGGNMMNEPIELVLRALELDPNHPKALWLAGAARLQSQDYQAAIVYWQRLMQMHQPGSEGARELQKRIDIAKQALQQSGGKLAEGASQPSSAQTKQAAVKTELRVTVDIDPNLKARAKADDTLFIFARAASGPPMPLAIVRKQMKDLPITVTLDDSMAMMPQARISNFEKVYVGARISKAGTARAQPGDLQGKSDTLNTGSKQSLAITINEIVK